MAFVASLGGAGLVAVMTLVLAGDIALRLVVAGLGLVYVIYLMRRSRERTGRITTLAAWTVAAAGTWILAPPLPLYVVIHAGLVWLIRSLYHHSSVLSALTDLGLTGLGLAAALWAGLETGSVFAAIWCFFLVQALFTAIPRCWRRPARGPDPAAVEEDRFERAHRAAEAALRKLSSNYR